MGAFGVIIALQLYESFDAATYFFVCGGLALPLWIQASLHFAACVSTRGLVTGTPRRAVLQAVLALWGRADARHALRAQLWVAIFGFIGNYWYTHYFYSVLRARYTMPAWRLNDVPGATAALQADNHRAPLLLLTRRLRCAEPVAMYFATHFYFCSYHVFANLVLRKAAPPASSPNPVTGRPPQPQPISQPFALLPLARPAASAAPTA